MAITCPDCGRQYDATLFGFGRSIKCDCGRTFDISQGHLQMIRDPTKGVLVDIAGVLHVGDDPIPGAAKALQRLQESGLPVRYVTNTTRSTCRQIVVQLRAMGFDLDSSAIFTAPIATLHYLRRQCLRPYFLVHPHLIEEFAEIDCTDPNAVVVGDAGDAFTYDALNKAFRVLMDGGVLIGMGNNRYFRQPDGLSLDMGPFVEALRFASGVEPTIIGKPSPRFFEQALNDMGIAATQAVMIGDDLENDIGGAQSNGLRGILVRTGKYRPVDEAHETIQPFRVVSDIVQAVDEILKLVDQQ